MPNNTQMAYQRDMFMLNFAGGCSFELSENISDYDDSIAEYQALLDNAMDIGDKDEIRQLRKEIQQVKAEKRIAKRMIDEKKNEKRIVYS